MKLAVPALAAVTFLALALTAPVPGAHAGLADALKKKIADKVTKKAEGAVDKADPSAKPAEAPEAEASEPASEPAAEKAAGEAGGKPGQVSAVSTKFDFVPGDSLLFFDDFTLDELGEFPARWKLVTGTFEVAERDGERWLRCVSNDGRVRLKLPAMERLPEYWTLEFDFEGSEPLSSALTVIGVGKGGQSAWEVVYPQGPALWIRSGEVYSSTPLENNASVGGRRHVMLMARGTALKVYLDRQRMANVPDVTVPAGAPEAIEIRLWASTQPMIANVRFAAGCRPAKDLLAEGKFVTYGIHFASGSDAVLPESAPTLRQITSYLEAHPAVKLQITGHTDGVGSAASNLDLSKRRAASVATVLAGQFGVAADRLATDGKGDTQAVASNEAPEGRAKNRRVEFAKR
jgi:outer membrane protein OmpA-like peptidoglycan-associated protein